VTNDERIFSLVFSQNSYFFVAFGSVLYFAAGKEQKNGEQFYRTKIYDYSFTVGYVSDIIIGDMVTGEKVSLKFKGI
jgi:hypothetical protein